MRHIESLMCNMTSGVGFKPKHWHTSGVGTPLSVCLAQILVSSLSFCSCRWQPVGWNANHSCHGGPVLPAGHHLHHHHPLHAQVGEVWPMLHNALSQWWIVLSCKTSATCYLLVCVDKLERDTLLCINTIFNVCWLTGLKSTSRQEAIQTPSDCRMIQVKHSHVCLFACQQMWSCSLVYSGLCH